jgi:prevent-host-death family protein
MITKTKRQRRPSDIVGLKELRENMEAYIGDVGKGRSFTVVRRSKPVFRVVPVDAWGDEGGWETIADFTEIDPRGVPAATVLRALEKLDGSNRKISRKA